MSSSLLRTILRSATSLVVLAIPLSSCVIKLSDKNAPEVNGGVTGPAANCAVLGSSILPRGAPGGDAALKYTGRFSFPDKSDPENPPVTNGTEFDWSGNSITAAFEGTDKVTVHLSLEGTVPQDQLFEFVIDKQPPTTRQITVTKDAKGAPTNTPETNYVIDHLSTGRHELTIWKNTEAQKGPVIFTGIDVSPGHLVPPTRRPRKMEVIGDSIICGYGIEGTNATCPFEVAIRKAVTVKGEKIDVTIPATENQFLSFTSQAARRLDADVTTICWSGKGLYLNYKESYRVDPTGALVADVDAKTTVPDLWKRTIANNGTDFPWDFSKEKPEDKPQVVFVSLGTNDFSRDEEPRPADPSKLPGDNVPDGDLLKPDEYQKFKDKYVAFVTEIRAARPDAHIFIATPPMLTDQFPLENARSRLRAALDYVVQQRAAQGDNKVYAMNLVEMGFRYGLGCDYHPNLEVHQIMADQLVGAIQSKTCWN